MWIIVDWANIEFIGPFKTKDDARLWLRSKHGLGLKFDIGDWELSINEVADPSTARLVFRKGD